jgi:hypothetical protein
MKMLGEMAIRSAGPPKRACPTHEQQRDCQEPPAMLLRTATRNQSDGVTEIQSQLGAIRSDSKDIF